MKKAMLLAVVFGVVLTWTLAFATPKEYSSGQAVYVPASHNQMNSELGTVAGSSLYIRNVNFHPDQWIQVTSVAFVGPDGAVVKEFLNGSMVLGPLATAGFVANEETLGIAPYPEDGGRPSWVVRWQMNFNLTIWPLVPIIESSRYIYATGGGVIAEVVCESWTSGTTIAGPSRLDVQR